MNPKITPNLAPQHIENLWKTYVQQEFSGLILPDDVMARIRKSFIMGFHTSHVFIRKILTLPDQQAIQLTGTLEAELKEHIAKLQRDDDFKKMQNLVWRTN